MANQIIPLVLLMHFPKRLAAIRKEHGHTQQVMADKCGIHVSQYKRYESGTSQPTLDVFRKLVLALNSSADMLLFEQSERDPGDDLRMQFEAINQFSAEEKQTVRELLEGMILKHEARRWSSPRTANASP
jgi:transcriptional regulator with XRE-family HTH domain